MPAAMSRYSRGTTTGSAPTTGSCPGARRTSLLPVSPRRRSWMRRNLLRIRHRPHIIRRYIHPYERTHAHPTSMSTSERLS
uniref:Uncharacterized protein n=1 Tax=Arundo donax TaxID=35708 RepID=A0A0A9G656_ARUDO